MGARAQTDYLKFLNDKHKPYSRHKRSYLGLNEVLIKPSNKKTFFWTAHGSPLNKVKLSFIHPYQNPPSKSKIVVNGIKPCLLNIFIKAAFTRQKLVQTSVQKNVLARLFIK